MEEGDDGYGFHKRLWKFFDRFQAMADVNSLGKDLHKHRIAADYFKPPIGNRDLSNQFATGSREDAVYLMGQVDVIKRRFEAGR